MRTGDWRRRSAGARYSFSSAHIVNDKICIASNSCVEYTGHGGNIKLGFDVLSWVP